MVDDYSHHAEAAEMGDRTGDVLLRRALRPHVLGLIMCSPSFPPLTPRQLLREWRRDCFRILRDLLGIRTRHPDDRRGWWVTSKE